jgi:hypothetical protein
MDKYGRSASPQSVWHAGLDLLELVPARLGAGTRLFADDGPESVEFEGPFHVVLGTGVTHLRYRVVK